MVNVGIFNASSNLENQIMKYKEDTDYEILCLVNKGRVLLLFTYMCFIGISFN